MAATWKQRYPRTWSVLVVLAGLGLLVGSWTLVAVQVLSTVVAGTVRILTFPLRH